MPNDQAMTAYQLLTLAPGPDISTAAAGNLLQLPTTQVARTLAPLVEDGTLDTDGDGRYRLSRGPAQRTTPLAPLSARQRADATRRLVEFYLHTAYAADRILSPSHPDLQLALPPGCTTEPIGSPDEALAWFDNELECLSGARRLALHTGLLREVWEMAYCVNGHYVRRGMSADQLEQWQDALVAAQTQGDLPAQVLAHRYYGQACVRAGRPAQARNHLRRAVGIAEMHGDPLVAARAHYIFAWVSEQAGLYGAALNQAQIARSKFQLTGQFSAEADALNAVGWYHTLLGQRAEASESTFAALQLSRRHRYREGQAAALDSLALAAQQSGLPLVAVSRYRSALELCRDLGNAYQEAGILDRLGDAHADAGEPEQARAAWSHALRLYQDQQRGREASSVRERLSALAKTLAPAGG